MSGFVQSEGIGVTVCFGCVPETIAQHWVCMGPCIGRMGNSGVATGAALIQRDIVPFENINSG